ncbi:MAG: flagellar hook-associated protein FlgL, partial [Thiobacillus sp.]|nr:flagellar hook-associated protein FlgL [Thiobacillus sp.]
AARALEVAQSQSINQQYAVNRVQAKNTLGLVDGVLSSVSDTLLGIRDALVAVGNPSLGDNERGFIASELSSRFQALLGLANTRDAQGNYLFAGFQSTTVPFVETIGGATYQGDAGQQLVQVDSTRRMAVSDTGQNIFQGGGQDVFQTLKDMVALLQTPVVTPANRAALTAGTAAGLADIDKAINNVLTVRASVGTRMQEIESLDDAGSTRNVQYKAILSEIQDLDYTEAITRQSRQQLTLEAAQQSFVKMASLSLFNFLR